MLRPMLIQTQKRLKIKTMKTTKITMKTLYICAVLLGFQINTIFAATSSGGSTVSSNTTESVISATVIAPATPAEATFEDIAMANSDETDLALLAPVIPMTADFSDGAPVSDLQVNLAPVTPKEADFEEVSATENVQSIDGLAPVTPENADFEETV
jgi:hypothetical protein